MITKRISSVVNGSGHWPKARQRFVSLHYGLIPQLKLWVENVQSITACLFSRRLTWMNPTKDKKLLLVKNSRVIRQGRNIPFSLNGIEKTVLFWVFFQITSNKCECDKNPRWQASTSRSEYQGCTARCCAGPPSVHHKHRRPSIRGHKWQSSPWCKEAQVRTWRSSLGTRNHGLQKKEKGGGGGAFVSRLKCPAGLYWPNSSFHRESLQVFWSEVSPPIRMAVSGSLRHIVWLHRFDGHAETTADVCQKQIWPLLMSF